MVLGASSAEEGVVQTSFPVSDELEPLKFDKFHFMDMNRTIATPLGLMAISLAPWLSIAGLVLGLCG